MNEYTIEQSGDFWIVVENRGCFNHSSDLDLGLGTGEKMTRFAHEETAQMYVTMLKREEHTARSMAAQLREIAELKTVDGALAALTEAIKLQNENSRCIFCSED